MRRSRRNLRYRAVRMLLVVTIFAGASPLSTVPVGASQTDGAATDSGTAGQDRVEQAPSALDDIGAPEGEGSSSGFLVWPSQRRGFFLSPSGNTLSEGPGFGRLSAADLETGEIVESITLPHPGWYRGFGRDGQGLALDEEFGLLYVPYQPAIALYVNVLGGLGAPEYLQAGRPCLTQSIDGVCPMGVSVLDARTLELVGDIPFQNIRADGAVLAPQLLAIHPAPSGKLLAVLSDRSTDVRVPFWTFQQETSPYYGANAALNYLAQFDSSSGQMEWIQRLDSCRGARESRDSSQQPFQVRLPGPSAIHVEQRPDGGAAAVWAACHTSSSRTAVMVRVPLDGDGRPPGLPLEINGPDPAAEGTPRPPNASTTPGIETYAGPDQVNSYILDPASGRFLMQVMDGGDIVWWVFDTTLRSYVGTIGIGSVGEGSAARAAYEEFGLDRVNGLLYSLTRAKGLLVAGVRSTPLRQAFVFPEWSELGSTDAWGGRMLMVLPGSGGDPSRVFVHDDRGRSRYVVLLHHRVAAPAEPVPAAPAVQSLDLDEVEGVTATSADGAARGYGARVLLVGGIEGAQRVGLLDPYGGYMGVRESNILGLHDLFDREVDPRLGMPTRNPCMPTGREVTLGYVGPSGPAVVDGSGARGTAAPFVIDAATQSDAEAPVSRCTGADWNQLWSKALFGGAPLPEPMLTPPASARPVACTSTRDQSTSDASADSVADPFAATVACDGDESSGYAYARGLRVGDVDVAQALSSFRIYRDPARGMVARVESVARGISVGEVLRIGTVRGTAESWANGRAQPAADTERAPGYDANCDIDRSAGTCFQRHLFGIATPGYSCGPCGDERQAVEGMSRALGSQAAVRLREPDANLARGTADGSLAAVQKPDSERFADLIMNQDLLQTTVPVLEIVRYAAGNRHFTGGPPRGRQIYQFAGVEVSSSYGIHCLLVYDEATNTCGAPVEPPGSLEVSLQDGDGTPLPDGVFEVRRDVDGDGALGLADELVPDGTCVTAADGVGTCLLEGLAPGQYLVQQTDAPTGYAAVTDAFTATVDSGTRSTVVFTNASDVSEVVVSATDDAGQPLAGATFALFADPEADGEIAGAASPVATCTTGASGECRMRVPTGAYVLMQLVAPAGTESAEPVAFAFTGGGQVAAVGIVNGVTAVESTTPVAVTPPASSRSLPAARPPAASVPDEVGPPVGAVVAPPALPGATITRVIRAPGDALRLLARDPLQALAMAASVGLMLAGATALRRRQAALALIQPDSVEGRRY